MTIEIICFILRYKTYHLCKCNRSKLSAETAENLRVISEIPTHDHDGPLFASDEIQQLSGWSAKEFDELLAEYRVPGKY